MLHSVAFENLGPHEKFEQDFGPGITLILGPNGIGKSNILYGIGWTVFGHKALPAEYVQSDIIRDGQKSVSGSVVMDLLGVPHTFSRTYDGKNVLASVFRGDEEVATGAKGVEEFLASYGLDWQAASVLFSRQRELDSFVYETPAKRKEIFESLLRVEVVNEARKIALKKQKSCAADPDPILGEGPEASIKANIKKLADIAVAETIIVNDLQDEVESLTELRQASLDALTEASNDKEARRIQGWIRQQQDSKYKLQKKLDGIEPIIKSAPVFTDAELVKANAEVTLIEADLVNARSRLKFAEDATRDFRDDRSKTLGRIEAMNETLKVLKMGNCPTCGTHIDDAEVHVAAVHGLSRTDLNARLDEIEKGMASSTEVVTLSQTDITAVDARRLELSSELDAFNYAVSLVPEAVDITSQINVIDIDIADHEQKIAALSGPSPEMTEAFKNYDTALTEKKQGVSDHTRVFEDAEKRHTDQVKILAQFLAAEEEYAANEETRKLYAAASKALGEFRNQVLQSALNWVSVRATQIVRLIGTLPDSGPTVQLSLDKDLQFWFTNGDKDTPVYRFSGGQKAVFAICLRMALSEYFSDRLGLKGFLLLDAVLDSLTKENQDATAHALQASGPQQAIIFSHFDVEDLEARRVRL